MSGGPDTKRPKFSKQKNYFKSNKKNYLEVGQRGFLATCNFRERECVRECYNILNQYADVLYGPAEGSAAAPKGNNELEKIEDETAKDVETKPEDDADDGDIADDLQKEINVVKEAQKQKGKGRDQMRFNVVETGTTNCVFIRTTLQNPVEVVTRIVKDIAEQRKQITRFLLRLIPVEAVCRAKVPDILLAADPIFDKYFETGCKYAVVFNKRYNNDLARDDVIRELAQLVQKKSALNSVDLKTPEKTIVVEVIKGLCCISVVERYLQYKKYNLFELANAKQEENVAAVEQPVVEDKTTVEEAVENAILE